MIRSSSTIAKSRNRGLTLLEALLSGFLFLLLMTAILSLLSQSVKLLEPSSEDKLSEVLHLANKIRADMRVSDTVTVAEDLLTLSGTFNDTPFTVTYAPSEKDVLRTLGTGESSKFFVSAEQMKFVTVGDNLLRVSLEVLLGERTTSLRIESAFPAESTTPLGGP